MLFDIFLFIFTLFKINYQIVYNAKYIFMPNVYNAKYTFSSNVSLMTFKTHLFEYFLTEQR